MTTIEYDATATVFLAGGGAARNFTVAANGSREVCVNKLQEKITYRLLNTNEIPVTIHYSFIEWANEDGE